MACIEQDTIDMQGRRLQIEHEIANLYRGIETTPYTIFSIIIHEGTADSGHYYCFIRSKGDNWFKFNDLRVTAVPKEEVYRVAFGSENSIANAYCLFYMCKNLFTELVGPSYKTIEDKQEGYISFIP